MSISRNSLRKELLGGSLPPTKISIKTESKKEEGQESSDDSDKEDGEDYKASEYDDNYDDAMEIEGAPLVEKDLFALYQQNLLSFEKKAKEEKEKEKESIDFEQKHQHHEPGEIPPLDSQPSAPSLPVLENEASDLEGLSRSDISASHTSSSSSNSSSATPLKVVAPDPWGRIVQFLITLSHTLHLPPQKCFASHRFHLFLESYNRTRNTKSLPEPEDFLMRYSELLVSRVARFVNWSIEKALLECKVAALSSGMARELTLYDIVSNQDCVVRFTSLCALYFFDIAVFSGRKYMPHNATKLDDITQQDELRYFRNLRKPPPVDIHGDFAFDIDPGDAFRISAIQKLASAIGGVRVSPGVVLDADLRRSFSEFENHFVLYLLGLAVPAADLPNGLPKTEYFIRLLKQAASKTEKEEDLDLEIRDYFPAYHKAAIIENTGDLAHSVSKSCVVLKQLCPVTLARRSIEEIVEWACRDRTTLVSFVQFIVFQYSIFVKVLERRSAGMNPLTTRRMHKGLLSVSAWFKLVYP